MTKLKIGLVGTSQLSFPGDKEARFRRSLEGLRTLSKELDFELYIINETVISEDQAERAVNQCERNDVDFLLVQCTSYSAGALAPIFAKSSMYLGLWAIPEEAHEGVLPFNSFCSINMFSSIIGHYCKEYKIPFKWFYGNVEDKLFNNRFSVTVKALTALKNLRKSKIALIGGIAPGFNDLYFDERIIEKTFKGLKINRLHEFSEIKDRALSYRSEEIGSIAAKMFEEANSIHPKSKSMIETNARMYKAYKDFIAEYGYDALAVSCWPKFQTDFQFAVCSVVAQLNDDGIAVACEGDLPSAVSMLMMQYLANSPAMLMDLSEFDENDETVLMWHCGPASKSFMNKNGYSLGVNYHGLPHINGQEPSCCGIVRDMVFKPGHVTISRITGEGDKLFLAEGDFIDYEKKSFLGSRGWIGNLKLNRETISVLDFVNTILVRRFQHHYPVAAGDFSKEIMEIASWLKMPLISKAKYQDYMQNNEGEYE